jgi:hypothetical protein
MSGTPRTCDTTSPSIIRRADFRNRAKVIQRHRSAQMWCRLATAGRCQRRRRTRSVYPQRIDRPPLGHRGTVPSGTAARNCLCRGRCCQQQAIGSGQGVRRLPDEPVGHRRDQGQRDEPRLRPNIAPLRLGSNWPLSTMQRSRLRGPTWQSGRMIAVRAVSWLQQHCPQLLSSADIVRARSARTAHPASRAHPGLAMSPTHRRPTVAATGCH